MQLYKIWMKKTEIRRIKVGERRKMNKPLLSNELCALADEELM